MEPLPDKFFSVMMGENRYLMYKDNTLGQQALSIGDENTKMKKQSDKFQFRLTKQHGFMICADKNILTTEQGKVDASTSQTLTVSAAETHTDAHKDGTVWFLRPSDDGRDDLPFFHIEQPYDLVQPRLVCQGEGAKSKLTVTCKVSEGYDEPDSTMWKIHTQVAETKAKPSTPAKGRGAKRVKT